jgi:hypothetical protein
MSRPKYFKNSTPEIEDRLNQHNSHYSDYLTAVTRVHNAQVDYVRYPNRITTYEFLRALVGVKKQTLLMYNDLVKIRMLINAEDKARRARRSLEIKERDARRAEKRKLKNDNN